MTVRILGTGCPKCRTLEERVRRLVEAHHLAVRVEKVTNLTEILSYRIMTTPGLVVDGEVKSSGVIPSDQQLLAWMKGASR